MLSSPIRTFCSFMFTLLVLADCPSAGFYCPRRTCQALRFCPLILQRDLRLCRGPCGFCRFRSCILFCEDPSVSSLWNCYNNYAVVLYVLHRYGIRAVDEAVLLADRLDDPAVRYTGTVF